MRNLGLAKKALLLALCAALAVPAAGMGWTPLTAEAEDPVKTPEELLQEAKDSAIVQIEDHYIGISDSIPEDKKS